MALEAGDGPEQAAAAAISTIEQLPADVMVRTMSFLELPERVEFARYSKRLQRLVFKDCGSLWTDLDFSELDCGRKLHLTDERLASLLTHVNAWSVTRTLDVSYCSRLQGAFLDPLVSSRTLEKVYLQQEDDNYDRRLDHDLVVRYLRSMIPFKLSVVQFHTEHPTYACVSTDFLRELRAAWQQRARKQNLACSACQQVMVDEASRQVVIDIRGVPRMDCWECKRQFCRQGSCSVGLTECISCGDTSCEDCARTTRCTHCAHSICEKCGPAISCASCSQDYCDKDWCDMDIDECSECEKRVCDNCHGLPYCDNCGSNYCHDCRKVNFCSVCDALQCETCAPAKQCSICSNSFCVDCRKVYLLGCCQQWVCEACVPFKQCDACRMTLCACERVEKCTECEQSFCEGCMNIGHCDHCSKSFCGLCREVEEGESCGACKMKCICNVCREKNNCEICFKSLCSNDDCVTVVHCGVCKTRYCEDCAPHVRRSACRCCRKCRQKGCCCPMCAKQANKKKKLSLGGTWL